ncbi:MAG TPA: protein kinase [Kofleriaceae bacterium]|jgi:tetratricopeptide (TPR) repeat protein
MRPGELVETRFEVEHLAGSGGMGTVYRALDRATGQPVAIKVLKNISRDTTDRFAREINVLGNLRHPGIVRYIADGVADGEMWLAMEWLEGESLAERLGKGGLSAAESVDLVRRVGEALGAAHARGVVHRDVKPSNLFLVNKDLERVKVLDFGVARVSDASITRTGVMVGTPSYMAPEQARGDRDVGPRSDVFGLGCLLYECLTGRAPFTGDNVMAVLAKVLLEDAPRVGTLRDDLPDAIDDLLARALSKQAEERPRDGATFAAELAALGTVTAEARPPSAPSAALTSTERRLLCVVLIDVGDHEDIDTAATRESSPTVEDATSDTVAEQPMLHLAPLREAAEAHGAQLQRLVDGSVVVTLLGTSTAPDQAIRAARCALALEPLLDARCAIALATGRVVMAGRMPVGEAIDRAASLLSTARRGTPARVRIDDVTAGLLDTRFEIRREGTDLELLRERDERDAQRTLLGKPTPCVGRDREINTLLGLYDESASESVARVVLITGPAGIGKSRVRYELLRRLAERTDPPDVWIGRGDPLRAGSPFALIAPALRSTAGIHDSDPADVRRQKLRARVWRDCPVHEGAAAAALARTAFFLGELIGAPFPDEDSVELRAARQDAPLMADQILRAFVHFLSLETEVRPVVLVLDDLHWGDLPTTKLVDAALRMLADRPLLVVALARPEVQDQFPRMWHERNLQTLRLDELTKRGSERLVREVLGSEANDALVARIVERSGGNAFYLEELIRAVAEGKGDEMPETVLATVQGRLERLELDARRVLRAAAVFGTRFWRRGLTALLGGEAREESVRAWIDELVHRELISRAAVSRFSGDDELTFRHAMVREAAYAMLTDRDRTLGHQLAGEWLEAAGEIEPVVLAEHFERGAALDRAAAWFRRAADQALAAGDFATAALRAERGVACRATGAMLGALRRVQAEVHAWRGELLVANRCASEAMELLVEDTASWFAAAGEAAETSGKLGDTEQLARIAAVLQRAVGRATGTDADVAAKVSAIARCAFQLFNHGKVSLAEKLCDGVELVAIEARDPHVQARIHQTRSSRAMFAGDAGAYVISERAAAHAFAEAGDLRYACMQHGHVGYAYLEVGAFQEAETWLRRALDGASRMGLQHVGATAKHNLGRALAYQGRLDEALAIETEAVDAFVAQGDRRLEAAARSYLAHIMVARGELGAAEVEERLALSLTQAASRPAILARLSNTLLALRRDHEAFEMAREAHALLDELGGIEEGESLIRLMIGETLHATGDASAARVAIGRARDRLLERASKITDLALRESFLANRPENARTLALAAKLLPDAQALRDGR